MHPVILFLRTLWTRALETVRPRTRAAGAVWTRALEAVRRRMPALGTVWTRVLQVLRPRFRSFGIQWSRTLEAVGRRIRSLGDILARARGRVTPRLRSLAAGLRLHALAPGAVPFSRAVTVSAGVAVLSLIMLSWVLQPGAGYPAAAALPRVTPVPTAAAPVEVPEHEPRTTFTPAPSPSPSPTPAPATTRAAEPAPLQTSGLRIRIPGIGIDRRMYGHGLSSEGTIDPDHGSVMWFTGYERVRPGRIGTAVIAGHVASGSRRDVFADLADVDVGDTVQVYEKGKTIAYRVTRAGAVDKYDLPSDKAVWGVNTSRSRLAIITCDDAFGYRDDGHRVANFVVIAERR